MKKLMKWSLAGLSLAGVAAVSILPVLSCSSNKTIKDNYNTGKGYFQSNQMATLDFNTSYTFSQLMTVLVTWTQALTELTLLKASPVRTQTFQLAGSESTIVLTPVSGTTFLTSENAKLAEELGVSVYADEQYLMFLDLLNQCLTAVWNGATISGATGEITETQFLNGFNPNDLLLNNLFGTGTLGGINSTVGTKMMTIQQLASYFSPWQYFRKSNYLTTTYDANGLRFYNTYAFSTSSALLPYGDQIQTNAAGDTQSAAPQINTLGVYYSPSQVDGTVGVNIPIYTDSSVVGSLPATYGATPSASVLSSNVSGDTDFWQNNAWFYYQMLMARWGSTYITSSAVGRVLSNGFVVGAANLAPSANPFFNENGNFATILSLYDNELDLNLLNWNYTSKDSWSTTISTTLSELNSLLTLNGFNDDESYFTTHFKNGIEGFSGTGDALYQSIQTYLADRYKALKTDAGIASICDMTFYNGYLYNSTANTNFVLQITETNGAYSLNWVESN